MFATVNALLHKIADNTGKPHKPENLLGVLRLINFIHAIELCIKDKPAI
jgi:hypothetical protein